MARLLPSSYFMWIPADTNIGGDNDPIFLARQFSHPTFVFHVWRETLFQMDDLVFGFNRGIHRPRQLRGKIVVEEKIHAASCCSNSTASLTAFGLISNQRATS